MPPPSNALLLKRMLFVTVSVPKLNIPPPPYDAPGELLPERTLPVTISVLEEPQLEMPPPADDAKFSEMTLLETITLPYDRLEIPPPSPAVLLMMALLM